MGSCEASSYGRWSYMSWRNRTHGYSRNMVCGRTALSSGTQSCDKRERQLVAERQQTLITCLGCNTTLFKAINLLLYFFIFFYLIQFSLDTSLLV